MTASELIAHLQQFKPDARVQLYTHEDNGALDPIQIVRFRYRAEPGETVILAGEPLEETFDEVTVWEKK